VAVSPDGRRIVSGSEDGLVKVWDAATGRELLSFGGHTQFIMAVAFSPDGGRILTGGGQWGEGKHPGDVRIWDAVSGRLLLDLQGHEYCVWSVAFSADGQRIVSCAGDWTHGPGEIKVWNAATGEEVLTFACQRQHREQGRRRLEPVLPVLLLLLLLPAGSRLCLAHRHRLHRQR
jgi:WD40 repeat protein